VQKLRVNTLLKLTTAQPAILVVIKVIEALLLRKCPLPLLSTTNCFIIKDLTMKRLKLHSQGPSSGSKLLN
jgi:hypothetical protein